MTHTNCARKADTYDPNCPRCQEMSRVPPMRDDWRKPHEDETVGEVFGGFFGWAFALMGTLLMMAIGYGVPAYGLVRFVKWAWQG